MLLVRSLAVVLVTLCLCAQEAPAPGKDRPKEYPPVQPRLAPTDYQAHAPVGAISIGAEFAGHSVPTPEATYTTEDFVVVEIGIYGNTPDAHAQISMNDFSLNVNGKKAPLSAEPFGLVLSNLKDPSWEPPESKSKSKGGINTGGGESNSPPPVVHMPIELQHAMAQRVQKAALPLGDRALPTAGLLFFKYRGKVEKINSLELIYSGPAGKATLKLHPGH
jgi:hypothetical protein